MIIDFHTHAFPEKIVARAIEGLAKDSGNVIPFADGTAGGLIGQLDEAFVDKSVVLHIATNEKQTANVNNFALELNGYEDRLISFGSVYPKGDVELAVSELYRLHENGIKGIKLHPEYQDFFVDDPAVSKVYDTVKKLGLITVFHAGMDNGFRLPVKAPPQRFAAIMGAFGDAPVVLAHSGGYILWNEVLELLAGRFDNMYFDTSFCYSRIPLPILKDIVERQGADHILFGSDSPWSPPVLERRLVEGLELSDFDLALVLGGNAERILKEEITL